MFLHLSDSPDYLMLLYYSNRWNFFTGMNQYLAVYFNISFANGFLPKNRYLKKNCFSIYIKFVERIHNHVPQSQNTDQPVVNSLSASLKLMSSRMSPGASHRRHPTPSIRHPGKFPRQFWPPAFFAYKCKTSAFVTGKRRLMAKGAVEHARMGSISRQNAVLIFRHAHSKKIQVFTRVGLLLDPYSLHQLFL